MLNCYEKNNSNQVRLVWNQDGHMIKQVTSQVEVSQIMRPVDS